jgi:ATP adenylyltransferase
MPADCLICDKHRGEGPLSGELIARLDGFWVWHAPPGDDATAPLGHLIIESDRHLAYLADLTDDEAAALGRLRTRLARALRAEVGPDYVFAAVIGLRVAHFHEHLICRHPGTPAEIAWHESDDAGPRADREAVADLARRIAARLKG